MAQQKTKKTKKSPSNQNSPLKAGRVARWAGNTTKSGLETLVKTGKYTIKAANPISDAVSYGRSLKNIILGRKKEGKRTGYHIRDGAFKKGLENYLGNAKQGKFLGNGDLSNVLFKTGIVASGLYFPLLGMRAGIGAGSYLGKELITTKPMKWTLPRLVSLGRPAYWTLEKLLRIKEKKLTKALSRKNIRSKLDSLDDKKYEKIQPYIMDAAIGLRGYGTLIGTKWLAGIAENLTGKVEKNSKWGIIRKPFGLASRLSGFTKNAVSDYISLKLASRGYHNVDMSMPDKDTYKNFKKYFKDQRYVADIKDAGIDTLIGFQGIFDLVKGGLNKAANSVVNAGKSSYDYWKDRSLIDDAGKGLDSIKDTYNSTSNAVKNFSLDNQLKDIKNYLVGEDFKNDFVKFGKNLGEKLHKLGIVIYKDGSDTLLINPQDRYAVLVVGHDKNSPHPQGAGNDRLVANQARNLDSLTDLGFPMRNITIMSPQGDASLNSSGYPEGDYELRSAYQWDGKIGNTENLAQVLEEYGKKVDSNDIFVLHFVSHGGNDSAGHSYMDLMNGNELVKDTKLAEIVKPIEGGLELYLITGCESGDFAKNTSNGNNIIVTAAKPNQDAIVAHSGKAIDTYLMNELKKFGLHTQTSREDIKHMLVKAGFPYRDNHGGIIVQQQDPQVGQNGITTGSKPWFNFPDFMDNVIEKAGDGIKSSYDYLKKQYHKIKRM